MIILTINATLVKGELSCVTCITSEENDLSYTTDINVNTHNVIESLRLQFQQIIDILEEAPR